jgi:hypothetical protein
MTSNLFNSACCLLTVAQYGLSNYLGKEARQILTSSANPKELHHIIWGWETLDKLYGRRINIAIISKQDETLWKNKSFRKM